MKIRNEVAEIQYQTCPENFQAAAQNGSFPFIIIKKMARGKMKECNI